MEQKVNAFSPIMDALTEIQAIAGRIYHAEALKNASAPFVFWKQDSEETEQALSGYTDLETAGYEIHMVARKLEQLDPIARAVRAALIALQGTEKDGILYEQVTIRQTSPEINEKEVGLFRKVYYITVNYQMNQ